ncbi:MAG: PIN domain-containing protein [Solirubrobacterales bacterium]
MAKPRRYFLDTNVLVHALDVDDERKSKIAQQLIEKHSTQLVISTQVLIELYSACVGKLGKSPSEAMDAVRSAAELAVVPADRTLVLESVAAAEHNGLSVFDAAIVSAAIRAECDELLTEDARIAQSAMPIAVVDPFAA